MATPPKYPSSFQNGVSPGGFTTDNVANRLILKDTVVGTISQGQYPTDQTVGTEVLSNSTNVLGDLTLALAQFQTEKDALVAAVAAISAASDARVPKYAANEDSIRVAHIRREVQNVIHTMSKLTARWNLLVTNGVPAAGRYPSDWNRGY